MPLLHNVCREVLRLDPPGAPSPTPPTPLVAWVLTLCVVVPITARQATEDDVFEGIHIPKDTIIHFPSLVINTNHVLWGDDADEFRPDRWDSLKDVSSTQFLTFQHGMVSDSRGLTGDRSSSVYWTEVCGDGDEGVTGYSRRVF